MPTLKIKPSKGPYASVRIASYQPVVVNWISTTALKRISSTVTARLLPLTGIDGLSKTDIANFSESNVAIDQSTTTQRLNFFDSVLFGSDSLSGSDSGKPLSDDSVEKNELGKEEGADIVEGGERDSEIGVDVYYEKLVGLFNSELGSSKEADEYWKLPVLWPGLSIQECLSPVGLVHNYIHYYFDAGSSVGPIEQALTIGPYEQVEVIYQTTRKQTFEEEQEQTGEFSSELEQTDKTTEELSEKVSRMIENSKSTTRSANVGVSTPVVSAGGSLSTTYTSTDRRSREQATRFVKEKTIRAAERIKKSFRITTRTVQEYTASNTTRRTISNTTDAPVNYVMRRVLRDVEIKVQDVGPQLVWQTFVSTPEEAIGKTVFLGSIAPNLPIFDEEPKAGEDVLWLDGALTISGAANETVVIITKPELEEIKRRRVTGAYLISSGIKAKVWSDTKRAFTFKVDVASQDPDTGQVTFNFPTYISNKLRKRARGIWSFRAHVRYYYEPSKFALEDWATEKKEFERGKLFDAVKLQLDAEKETLRDRGKVQQRPSEDLREEERYALMGSIIKEILPAFEDIDPIELETFYRLFDVSALFYFPFPSWWKPKPHNEQDYEVTSETEPVKFGSSLGWNLQSDGDAKRDAFINSPIVRICLPIQPGQEIEAMNWLANHIEGRIGQPKSGGFNDEIDDLLENVRKVGIAKNSEREFGPENAKIEDDPEDTHRLRKWLDEVRIEPASDEFPYERLVWEADADDDARPTHSHDGSANLSLRDIYPVFHGYDSTEPVDGFVYSNVEIEQ